MQRCPLQFPAYPRLAFAVLAGGVFAALLLAGVTCLLWWLAWPQQRPPGDPDFGINFSCRQAEYLAPPPAGTNRVEWCAAVFERVVIGLGVRHVRLSAYWDAVEPAPGTYDFAEIDALLAVAGRHDVEVLLTVGMKAQRHPEYFIPSWLLDPSPTNPALRAQGATISDDPSIAGPALAMVEALVRHVGPHPAVTSWQAENEPYIGSPRAADWVIGRDYVQELIAVIRAADPHSRPIVVNHAGYYSYDDSWRPALEDADILAQSIYPFRRLTVLGQTLIAPILEIGPLIPNYPWRADVARKARKDFWITEMQAEPWAGFPELADRATPRDITPGRFFTILDYSRRSGASRVYLWGAEWWLYRIDQFDDWRYWDIARAAVSASR
ncbi:MAG: beta-galactosidase [Dehalococcoidia bacterium]